MPAKKPTPEKHCATCKEKMERKWINTRWESMNIFLKRKYCDRVCMAKGQMVVSPSKGALHKRARKFIGQQCEACATLERLQVHHKDRNAKNNSKANLMTLCVACHTKWHWENDKMEGYKEKKCSLCDTITNHLRRGMCQKHYQRWKRSQPSYGTILKRKSGARQQKQKTEPVD